MTVEMAGAVGIGLLMLLLFAGMEIGFALAFLGFLGYIYLGGFDAALGLLATVPYGTTADYSLAVIPLFVLMGAVVSNSGITADLYNTGYRWVGHLPGGLAIGTIGACAGFAAICGSSLATAATLGKVAMPEMLKFKYNPRLASGCLAAGATLGILIPPSLGFIIYGILTEEPIGVLFVAGILPGLLLATFFCVVIYVHARRYPDDAPRGARSSLRERLISLRFTWPIFFLFLLVIGGLYFGFFTPGEAAAVGAFGSIVVGCAYRRLSLKKFFSAALETAQTSSMVLLLLLGAMIFCRFLAISKLPFAISTFVSELPVQRWVIFAFIIFVYILIGMFLDIMSTLVLTVPIIQPTILALGFDPIWFGVIMVIVMEMGLITPPVGMTTFVLSASIGVPVYTVFNGVWPFVAAMLFAIAVLCFFPDIALVLPHMMRH